MNSEKWWERAELGFGIPRFCTLEKSGRSEREALGVGKGIFEIIEGIDEGDFRVCVPVPGFAEDVVADGGRAFTLVLEADLVRCAGNHLGHHAVGGGELMDAEVGAAWDFVESDRDKRPGGSGRLEGERVRDLNWLGRCGACGGGGIGLSAGRRGAGGEEEGNCQR